MGEVSVHHRCQLIRGVAGHLRLHDRCLQRATRRASKPSAHEHGEARWWPDFAAKSEDAILSALRQILIDVKSVNSVFTSASVPINATNRAQYENQVYIGMFRPDGDSRPRWYGNLKRLQVGTVDGHIRLTDRNNDDAIAASTGFLKACAISYWTTDSGSYWNFSPSSAGLCTTMPSNVFSDLPDGPAVKKGGVGEVLRRSNDPASSNPPFAVSRNMYTCTSATNCSSLVLFNAANVSQSAVGAASAAEQQRIIDHTFGKDVNDDNGNGNATESRATIHGDVVHSRPLPVNYGGDTGWCSSMERTTVAFVRCLDLMARNCGLSLHPSITRG